jgi:nitroimidazol reductase NimA-like FMN-containing flavoprotein (pyridoxamine 5'-phosphate oxidase superfamily)
MPDRPPITTRNLDRYGSDTLPWSRVRIQLAEGATGPEVTHFLGTVDAQCRPHVAGVGAVWLDGDLYFTSSLAARKARNLATNPACTIAVRSEGVDLTLMGTAERVNDAATLERIAEVYRNGGWPAEVSGDALTAPYSAPSAGPPPWHLFRFTFDTVVGVATAEPYGATSWHFAR